MGIGGIWQWVVVLAIILLLFGTKKLRNLGSDLGHAVKGFRKGMSADEQPKAEAETARVSVEDEPAPSAGVDAAAEEKAPADSKAEKS